MKRMFISLVLAVFGIAATAIPANAYPGEGDGRYTTVERCVSRSYVETCVHVEWSNQSDGDGVRLEYFENNTPKGCANLEHDGNGAYNPVRPFWYNPRTLTTDYQYEFGAEGCEFQKNVSNAGSDKGCMDFRWVSKARVDGASDHYIYMGWRLCPNGSSDFLYKLTQDA